MITSKSLIVNKLKDKVRDKDKIKYNKSTIFLLPMLSECKSFLNTSNMKLLVNVYYHNEEDLTYSNNYKDRIYCVFKNTEEFISKENLSKIEHSINYITTSILEDYVVITFKIPYVYLNDYLLFKKGNYSKISDIYKKKLLEYYPYHDDYLKNILYPTDTSRKQLSLFLDSKESITEVYSRPNTEDEIFKISKFYKLKI